MLILFRICDDCGPVRGLVRSNGILINNLAGAAAPNSTIEIGWGIKAHTQNFLWVGRDANAHRRVGLYIYGEVTATFAENSTMQYRTGDIVNINDIGGAIKDHVIQVYHCILRTSRKCTGSICVHIMSCRRILFAIQSNHVHGVDCTYVHIRLWDFRHFYGGAGNGQGEDCGKNEEHGKKLFHIFRPF